MTTPTLLLVGEASSQMAHEEAEMLHDALPNSDVTVLENQQHAAYRMAPEAFAETVVGFLTVAS